MFLEKHENHHNKVIIKTTIVVCLFAVCLFVWLFDNNGRRPVLNLTCARIREFFFVSLISETNKQILMFF